MYCFYIMLQHNGLLKNNHNNNVFTAPAYTTLMVHTLFKCISLRVHSIPSSSGPEMRLIDLFLD